nr:MAG TPA: major capsid protein [Caudoviricetes sp.]
MKNERLKAKIQERITNLNTLGRIPADEVQLNIDVIYNSILDEICAIVPMDSPRQIISSLELKYGMPKKMLNGKDKDVVDATMMNNVGAMPLDEYGYPTDIVQFTTTDSKFIGSFKNIIPGSVKIGDLYTDDSKGKIIETASGAEVGTVDYQKAIFDTNITFSTEFLVTYKFDLYNIDTSRNLAYFEKSTKEIFADIYQLDADSAVVLNDFKGLNLQQNIDKILPQALTQQIDGRVLSKYFDLLDAGLIHSNEWDADSIKWPYDQGYSVTEFYEDAGTLVSLEMGAFAERTGVVPNVILCDPIGLAILKTNRGFKSITELGQEDVEYSGTPRKVGYFGTAKVFVVQHDADISQGKIILTYRGLSDAQASGVYAPFIPVTLRTVSGAEGGGMVVTNNIYSIGGFAFTNIDLISGINLVNIKF